MQPPAAQPSSDQTREGHKISDNFDVTQGAGKTIRAPDNGSGVLVQAVRIDATASQDGAFQYRILSANSTNATLVKASPAALWGWDFYNTNAAVRWLKLYNKTSAPTVGSDTPSMTIALKPGDHSRIVIPFAIPFPTGLSFALTTGVADSDTGAVAANEITGHVFWT